MTAWYVALLALIIAAVGAFLVLRLHSDLVAATDGRLNAAVDQIALGYHTEGAPEARDVSSTVLSGKATASQVLDPAGRVVASFGDRVSQTPMLSQSEMRQALAGKRVYRTSSLGSRSRRYRLVARATTHGGRRSAVVAGQSTASIDSSVHRLLTLLLLAWPVAVAATALGGWWLATRALRPIGRLTAEARQIGVERLAERLPVAATSDEVARLAETLNTMLARIEAGVAEQHRLIADASHELRTPLAAMRAELEVSLRGDDLEPEAQSVLRSTLEEVERLSSTVDGLLVLARADRAALALEVESVDLAAVVGMAAGRLGSLASSRDVQLELDLAPGRVRADPSWLGQAVGNLLDNAIKFSPTGGTVTVTTEGDAAESRVTVLDEGSGIAPGDRERVFDRFYRIDPSRMRAAGGSGIGLSIVREIALAHGGRVWVEPGPRGGSSFTLALPAAAPSDPSGGPSTEQLISAARQS
jgi:heavy metal sensor kinase